MLIYTRYGRAVRRKCERILRNVEDAEDVVQTLFCDLLAKGQTDVSLSYLYRAATNRCLNLLRDRKRRLALLDGEEPSVGRGRFGSSEGAAIGLDLLAKLIDMLDEPSAEILVYKLLDDMTQDEIAELTGTSRKTVGKRLARIRAAAVELGGQDVVP